MSDILNKHVVWASAAVLLGITATTGFVLGGRTPVPVGSVAVDPRRPSESEINRLSSQVEALGAQVAQLTANRTPAVQPASEEERLRQEVVRLQARQATAKTAPGAPTAINAAPGVNTAAIDNPAIGGQVLDSLAQLEGAFDAPVGTEARKTITVFFDPRCPYCHQAFTELHGKLAVRWVPVLALGNPGEGTPLALSVLAADDRVDALARVFATKKAAVGPAAPAELGAKLTENLEAFSAVFAAAGRGLKPGVPTLFVPRPDGRVVIMVGYEKGDDARIRSILEGA